MTWACLRVQLRQERKVMALLTEAGVLAYAPMETRKVVVKHPHRPGVRRVVPRTAPLIPNYVFVDLPYGDDGEPDEDTLDKIHHIRPIRGIMCNAFGRPRKVDTQRLGEIILMDAFKCFDETYEPPKRKGYTPRWKKGDRVKGAKHSNVPGWLGEVIGSKGGQQIEVMFVKYGRHVPVFVDDADLMEAVDSPAVRLEAA